MKMSATNENCEGPKWVFILKLMFLNFGIVDLLV
jgi:hypothetical protein